MTRKFLRQIMTRLIACILVLGAGFGAMQALSWMRTPPAQRPNVERALRVEALVAQPETVQVMMEGYGQVRALDVVEITPEVAGKIVAVHPKLEVGEVIPEGEVLFEIDVRDYAARQTEAHSQVEQLKRSIERLQTQVAIDKDRLKTLERSRELAKTEFERLQTLFEQDDVGTRSGVDAAERVYHAAADQADQLAQAIALYPLRIQETQDSLKAAEAGLTMTGLGVDRTKVRAPFTARVKRVGLEASQYVAPGVPVLTLANDSVLEISVSLDSRQAREWLQFKPGADLSKESWFNEVEPVSCLITWSEDERVGAELDPNRGWRGYLHRVERFDEKTRTVSVAVRIDGDNIKSSSGLPLVEGMFCAVAIPGRNLEEVYRLPRHAVGLTGAIFVASNNGRGGLGFDRASVQDPTQLSRSILEGQDPLSVYLRGRMSGAIETALAELEQEQRTALEEALALLDEPEERPSLLARLFVKSVRANSAATANGLADQREVLNQVHTRLDDYLSAHSPEERLVDVLVEELNGVLQEDALYDEARFLDVPLPEDLRARLQQPVSTDEERIRINRQLLELAYPHELGTTYRLHTRQVQTVRQQDEFSFVRGALEPGDYVVITRLVNPLENTLLDVTLADPDHAPAEVAGQ